VHIVTGRASMPRDTASATGPTMYAVWIPVTTPLSMWRTSGACAGNNELGAIVTSRNPARSISAITISITRSPLRK